MDWIWLAAVPIAGMWSMLLRLRATEEARLLLWSLGPAGPAVRRKHASPDPLIESPEPRRRPDHTSPTATRSQNHACLELPFERSSARNLLHVLPGQDTWRPLVRPVSRCDNSTWRDQLGSLPVMCRNRSKRSEPNYRYLQLFVSKAEWQASAHMRPHLPGVARAIDFVPRRSCPEKASARGFGHRVPACFPETPLCARR